MMDVFDRLSLDRIAVQRTLASPYYGWAIAWEELEFKGHARNCPLLFAAVVDSAQAGKWSIWYWGFECFVDRIRGILLDQDHGLGQAWVAFFTEHAALVIEAIDELVAHYAERFRSDIDRRIDARFLIWITQKLHRRQSALEHALPPIDTEAWRRAYQPRPHGASSGISAFLKFRVEQDAAYQQLADRGLVRQPSWQQCCAAFELREHPEHLPLVFAVISDAAVRGAPRAFADALAEIIDWLGDVLLNCEQRARYWDVFVCTYWWFISEVCIETQDALISFLDEQNTDLFYWLGDEIDLISRKIGVDIDALEAQT
jgi:hypothetical protein